MELSNIKSINLNQNKISEFITTDSELTNCDQNTSAVSITMLKKIILQEIYPVGSMYVNNVDGRNPHDILGFGTWTQIIDKYIYGVDTTPGSGGEEYITAEMLPAHNHEIDMSTEQDAGAHTHVITVYGYRKGGSDDQRNPVSYDATDWWGGRQTNWTTSDPGDHAHAIKGNTQDSAAATVKNLPAHQSFYIWYRTA